MFGEQTFAQLRTGFKQNVYGFRASVSRLGLALRLVSGRTSVWYRVGSRSSLFKKVVFVDTVLWLSITSYWNIKMAVIAAHLNAGIILVIGDSVAIGISSPSSPHLHTPSSPPLISRMISVDVKHHVYSLRASSELRNCVSKSPGGRPGLSVLMSLTVSVDVKQHWTMLRHWSQFVPQMSTDIRGHEALHHRVQDWAVRKSRWLYWAPRPNELYGFCGCKATSVEPCLGIGM